MSLNKKKQFLLGTVAILTLYAGPVYAEDEAPKDSDITVTGSRESQNVAVQKKRETVTIVDSVAYDDANASAADDSVATVLSTVPGVSVEKDADQPRYITVRGIQSDLNVTTIDGITMATTGDTGSGQRRVNLQLLPSEIMSRTDVFKAFSAEQDGGAIGADIDVVTRSAFDRPGRYLFIDTYGIYNAKKIDNGDNAIEGGNDRWGGGAKFNFANRYGSDKNFGIVLSARYQKKSANADKDYQKTKNYYDENGKKLTGPDGEAGWDGLGVPYDFTYYSDAITYETFGGSGKIEWQSPDDSFYVSTMLYTYTHRQQFTENGYNLTGANAVKSETENGGTQQLRYLNSYLSAGDRKRNNTGGIGTFRWHDDSSTLSLRSGYNREKLDWWAPYFKAYAKVSGTHYMEYAYGGDYDLPYAVGIDDPSIIDSSKYSLSDMNVTNMTSRQSVGDIRADYAYNSKPEDRGFGFAAGVEWRDLRTAKDQNETDYVTGSPNFNDYMYKPGSYKYPQAPYVFPFIDYDKFMQSGGYSNFAVNEEDTDYNSRSSDYRYNEKLYAAYLSLHLQTDHLTALLGGRYDGVRYTAFTPEIADGALSGAILQNKGKYDYFLPSLNLAYRLNDDTNLRFSASKTLGRPNPADIAQAEERDCTSGEDGGAGTCAIKRGNPNLKPRQSLNLDLSLDSYFGENRGMASLGLFCKKITDNIVTVTGDETIDGAVYSVRTPQNVDKSSICGAEISYVNNALSILGERFDVSANFSAMRGKMKFTNDNGTRTIHQLPYQPKWIANVSVAKYLKAVDGKASVAFNYTGSFIRVIGDKYWSDEGRKGYADLQASFKKYINKNMSIKFDVTNILNEKIALTVGDNLRYTRNVDGYGRTYYLHFSFNM